MQRKVSLGTSIIVLIIAVILGSFASVMAYKTWNPATTVTQDGTQQNSALSDIDREIEDVKKIIETYYIGDVNEEDIKKMTLVGFMSGLGDRYGGYYDAEGYSELMDDLEGDMQGIGVSVIYNYDLMGIEIIDVFPDSPAMEAGLETGDVITYCEKDGDYVSVAYLGYEVALNTLRGKAGTVAKFIAVRGASYDEELEFEITRDYVTEQSVRHRLCTLDDTVGIIKISGFSTATVEQFKEALADLKEKGVKKLIFDVRNNPGGELNSICSILDILVPEGPVIRTKTKNSDITTIYYSDSEELDMPMAVLVNHNTASAAELFTSTLKDYEKAVIVGETTYGKGSMQTMIQLPSGGGVKLTTALYYPPFSDNYDGIGVTPDVEISLSEESAAKSIYKLTDEEDDQLKAAIDALK